MTEVPSLFNCSSHLSSLQDISYIHEDSQNNNKNYKSTPKIYWDTLDTHISGASNRNSLLSRKSRASPSPPENLDEQEAMVNAVPVIDQDNLQICEPVEYAP